MDRRSTINELRTIAGMSEIAPVETIAFQQVADAKSDLLLGANAIADHLGITRRQTYRLVYDNHIPTFKVGGTVAARKSSLNAWLAQQEADARAVA